MPTEVNMELVLSGASLAVTTYFWVVKARKDRPNLQFHQLSDFRMATRRHPDEETLKRVCLQQIDTGGVLAVNHSTRQNSIVFFECYLSTSDGLFPGDWGYTGDDRPPWNIGPETTLAISPACFFDVPADLELPEEPEFRLQFITASGKAFSHRFQRKAPRLQSRPYVKRAA